MPYVTRTTGGRIPVPVSAHEATTAAILYFLPVFGVIFLTRARDHFSRGTSHVTCFSRPPPYLLAGTRGIFVTRVFPPCPTVYAICALLGGLGVSCMSARRRGGAVIGLTSRDGSAARMAQAPRAMSGAVTPA